MCPRTWLVELNIECLDLWPDCQVLLYDVVISLLWIRTRVDVVADSVVVIFNFSYVWELNLNWLVMCRCVGQFFCQDMWYHYQLDHLRAVCCTLLKWWYTFCLIFLLLWPEKIYLSYISIDLACRGDCMCTRFWPEGSVLRFYHY